MPERIYINRIAGELRIHIELAANEIADILDDFTPAYDAFDATKKLHQLLVTANEEFDQASGHPAREAEVSRWPIHLRTATADVATPLGTTASSESPPPACTNG